MANMVQGKHGTLSYKYRKLIVKPEDEWIRVENTHEAIIPRDVWDTVVSIDQKKVRESPAAAGRKNIFTGLVYCADCGFKMRSHNETRRYSDSHTQVISFFHLRELQPQRQNRLYHPHDL